MVTLLTTHIRRLREEIAQADWQGLPTDTLRLQLETALEAHARGEIWHVPF
jgi:hypothetical protein